ncbi:hypothetical protein OAM91_04120 [Gammaproteobacteria bacterium]|nr:hypothetical protein [Gammaproteobacteria bacterium]
MNKSIFLTILAVLLLTTACSKETITLLCKQQSLTHINGDFYNPSPGYQEKDAKIYISFATDQIGFWGIGIGENIKRIRDTSESYSANVEYDEYSSMYKSGYKSRTITIDRLTLDYSIFTFFTSRNGNTGTLLEGTCKKVKKQI